ncbi:MAG: hypothetical protein LBU73_08620 [Helicobacteraceae bacterium]|jgi:hypothetical protein|nr:hypothetical protein [Helicobacteraceae bacterium]
MMTQEEITEEVASFMDKFFGDDISMAQTELDFINANGFLKPQLDYIKMRRFLVTAFNNLRAVDPGINAGTLAKIRVDCDRIHEFLTEFMKKTKMSKLVYVRDFLPNVPQYRALENEITITDALKKRSQSIAVSSEREKNALPPPKTPEEVAYIKSLSKRYVDAIDAFATSKEKLAELTKEIKALEAAMSENFFLNFDEYVQNIEESMREILQIKSYYLDRLLWYLAAHSQLINKFFAQARIEGDYSTKTFIKYYLRNIDMKKSSASDWHQYLKEVLKEME